MASPGSQNWRGTHVGFRVNVETPKIRVRNELGQYTSAQAQQHAKNRELAFATQVEVAGEIKRKLKRPTVSTGRLVNVTLDPKNAASAWNYVAVGNETFLDRSIAKYWRTIEEGSAQTWTKRSFRSLRLQGIWGTNLDHWRVSGAGNAWVALGRPAGRGKAGKEMYHPFRFGPGANLPEFRPGREIEPQYAYARAAKKALPRYSQSQIAVFWKEVLDGGISPPGYFGGTSNAYFDVV